MKIRIKYENVIRHSNFYINLETYVSSTDIYDHITWSHIVPDEHGEYLLIKYPNY